MAKRFATMFFIMIGVVVFLLSAFLMVLFLAPGVQIFGIKYISVNTHGVNTGKVRIVDKFQELYGTSAFSGSVVINSDEVPVIVEFSESGQDYYYQYYDNYSGITNSTFDDPSISIVRDANGNAILTVNSFETFVFQNANSTRYLKLYVPLANISVNDGAGKQQYIYGSADPGASLRYTKNLTINSENAEISFYKNDASRAPAFNNVSIKTTGNIHYNNVHIKAMNFKFETDDTILVSSSLYTIVDAQSYDLNSTNGKVICQRELSGNLTATTKNGNIEVNRCKNLTINTELGDVVSCYDNRGIEIRGIVDIKTNAGSISISSIAGTGQNKIETGSGSVEIDKILNGTITTHRGAVALKSVNNITISTNMGNISVEEVLDSIDVSTKRGKIEIGAESMTVANVKASSTLGKVSVIDASGTVYIDTVSSDINFVNKNSQNIQIYAGGKLNAQNLKGIVSISAAETANLEFDTISNDTKVLLKESCSYVKIEATSVSRNELNYFVYGNPASIYESNNTGYATFSLFDSEKYLYNENVGKIKFEVIGDTKTGATTAVVDIYFDSSTDY